MTDDDDSKNKGEGDDAQNSGLVGNSDHGFVGGCTNCA